MDDILLEVRVTFNRHLILVDSRTGRVLVSLSLNGLNSDTVAKVLAEAITRFCEV